MTKAQTLWYMSPKGGGMPNIIKYTYDTRDTSLCRVKKNAGVGWAMPHPSCYHGPVRIVRIVRIVSDVTSLLVHHAIPLPGLLFVLEPALLGE